VKSLKRPRPNARDTADEDDDTPRNAFYLKHQNAALASELKQIQRQNKLLQDERDSRRKRCSQALEAIQQLEATWSQMESALQIRHPSANIESSGGAPSSNGAQPSDKGLSGIPPSTGTGESVEIIGALLDSLANLKQGTTKMDNGDQFDSYSDAISKRASCLKESIWALLRKKDPTEQPKLLFEAADLRKEISLLESQVRRYQHQSAELSHARDEAQKSERRVRRGLYRLSSGRMELKEVMQIVEETSGADDDAWLAESASQVTADVPTSTVQSGSGSENIDHDSADVAAIQKQLQDLEAIAASRQDQIGVLLGEQAVNQKRINELLLSQKTDEPKKLEISEDDVKRSGVYTETWVKMITAERQVAELKKQLEETKQMWGSARGDVDTAINGLEEHLSKHKKRWTELTGFENDDGDFNHAEVVKQQKQCAELRHKLKQALESVRQSDTIRSSLEESMAMNEALQTKLDEAKQKTAAILKMRENHSGSAGGSSNKGQEAVSRSEEKLHREHRKVRKELVQALQSKENAKSKLERVEKEREGLMKSNCQLLKQSAEKDDMNAKSLSTILHLKELTEKLSNEKNLLEQQVRSAEQVQLANRLATNARARVMEEVVKERATLEQKISGLQQECEQLMQEKDRFEGSLSKKQAEMEQLSKHTAEARSRCDELVSQSTQLQSEKSKLVEEVAAAQRQAAEAAKKYASYRERANDGPGTERKSSEFTTDQLTTQINVLKNRLVCDVCNLRDKKCMIIRCRHMFCKPCVEENIKNRSRKCPACGQRFDTKDVVDIWL